VIASILREALRISRKKEASCRIDNPSLFENLRAYPCLQPALRHQIDPAPDQSLQLLAQRFELEQPNARAGVEFDHDVDIAARQGAGLPDPKHLLKGSGKIVRHVVLASAADLDQPAIQGLMATARKRAEPSIDPDAPGILVIRSVSAKQRPRRPA